MTFLDLTKQGLIFIVIAMPIACIAFVIIGVRLDRQMAEQARREREAGN